MITVQIHQEVYDSLKEMMFLLMMLILILIAVLFNSKSSKYKVALVRKTNAADGNSFVKNTKIVIPSNYLNFGYY